jgi:type III restriction enzyme
VNIELKPFQVIRTRELVKKFVAARSDFLTTDDGQALALSAPTGSGKTVIATSFIEQVMFGSDDVVGDEGLVVLWLTDQPQLNEQTANKMHELSEIDPDRIVVIDETFTDDFLKPGHIYFLNTQKLGANSSLVNVGGMRGTSLWDALATTINDDPSKFLLVVDEAHRGMKDTKADPEFATTIVQRFIKGSVEHKLSSVPLILGISATITRFHELIGTTSRTERKVEVTVAEVRESGLVKDLTRLKNSSNTQHTDVTMLNEAIGYWREFQTLWAQYAASQNITLLDPILLVQVEDGTSTTLTKSPLEEILSTIYDELEPVNPDWLAHSFQTGTNIAAGDYGYPVRFLAPSGIDADPDVRVVLFKSSLNTGWDCPRAEVMVSFRSAKDPTSIAQLVGRMVRSRLTKQVVKFEVLNTCVVVLPRYESATVKNVVALLNGAGGSQTGSDTREEDDLVWHNRAKSAEMDAAFELLGALPSMLMPSKVKMASIDRLFRLAGLLAETKLRSSPIEDATTALVAVLMDEFDKRNGTPAFEHALAEATSVAIISHDHRYGEATAVTHEETMTAQLSASDLEGRYVAAEQTLNSRGLANAFMDLRLAQGGQEDAIKAEFFSLAYDGSVLPTLHAAAVALTDAWLSEYRTSLQKLKATDEERYERYKELLTATGKPEVGAVSLSEGSIEWPKSAQSEKAQQWPRHMYVPKSGGKFKDYLNGWEEPVMKQELSHPDVVAWFRNPPRKPWSLRTVYQSGTSYIPFYPDFVLFTKNASGDLEPSIVDPHLLNDAHAPQRAAGLAQYAADFQAVFKRIDMIIVEHTSGSVDTIKRLNLMNPATMEQVAQVSSAAHLQALFDNAPLYP